MANSLVESGDVKHVDWAASFFFFFLKHGWVKFYILLALFVVACSWAAATLAQHQDREHIFGCACETVDLRGLG